MSESGQEAMHGASQTPSNWVPWRTLICHHRIVELQSRRD